MRHTPEQLPRFLAEQLTPYLNKRRWIVAFSGGLDSTVLLYLARQLLDSLNTSELNTTELNTTRLPELWALHIHHGLNPQADDWQHHCQQIAAALAVPCEVRHVNVNVADKGLEAAARRERYRCFSEFVGAEDALLLGHHADDQAETLLYRLLRGAGVAGLAGMPAQRPLGAGLLLRPLLALSREELQHYAGFNRLSWVNDASNDDERFDRNYLRHQLMPLLAQRWPAYLQTLGRAAEQMADAVELITTLAAADYHACRGERPGTLDLQRLCELSPARRRALLRYSCDVAGLSTPSAAQLHEVEQQLIDARDDSRACVGWPGVAVRRFQGLLYLGEPLPEIASDWQCQWRGEAPLALPAGGTLELQRQPGQGLREAGELTVRYRQGGERCQPAGRGHSQSLKKLFQEYHIAPWLRDRTPLLYRDEQLVAVAGYWICEGYQVETTGNGYWPDWSLATGPAAG